MKSYTKGKVLTPPCQQSCKNCKWREIGHCVINGLRVNKKHSCARWQTRATSWWRKRKHK